MVQSKDHERWARSYLRNYFQKTQFYQHYWGEWESRGNDLMGKCVGRNVLRHRLYALGSDVSPAGPTACAQIYIRLPMGY